MPPHTKKQQHSEQSDTIIKKNIPVNPKDAELKKLWDKFYYQDDFRKSTTKKKRFRIRAKRFFLTYSQIPNWPEMFEVIRACLEKTFGDSSLKNMRYIFTREDHVGDGSHVAAKSGTLNSRQIAITKKIINKPRSNAHKKKYKKIEMFSLFMPTFSNFLLDFFFSPNRLISYIAKPIILSVWLFINLMDGNSWVKVIV